MKKIVAVLLSLMLVAALVPIGFAEDIHLTYLSSTIIEYPECIPEQAAIDAFNALDNGITVEVISSTAADLPTKLTSAATTGELPDFVMASNNNLSNLYDLGVLTPVTEVVDEEFFNSFTEASRRAFMGADGNFYGVPWWTNQGGILYRKDIFEAAGLTPPTTWDELVEDCKKLTGDGKYGMALIGIRNNSGSSRFEQVCTSFGVKEFFQDADGKWQTDVGGDNFKAALTAFTELDTVHKVCQPGTLETTYPDSTALFASGTCAMLITGSNGYGSILYQAPDLNGKVGSIQIPGTEEGYLFYQGYGFMVTTKDPSRFAAINEFLKFLISVEGSISYATVTGRIPTLQTAYDDPRIEQIAGLDGYIATRDSLAFNPLIPGYSEIMDIYSEAYTTVLAGEATVEEAAANAYERAQGICDEANDM